MSPASYWEIAIKLSMGKWQIRDGMEKFMADCIGAFGFQVLAIEPRHAVALSQLPFSPEHRDPFDRLLVCQALVEDIPLLSADKALDFYGVNRIW